MQQRPFRRMALLLAAGLFGLVGGYINEAVARDHGIGHAAQYRDHGGHQGAWGRSPSTISGGADRRNGHFRRDEGHRRRSNDEGYGRHRPPAYHHGQSRSHSGRAWRRDEFDQDRRGWRERQSRFDRHDRGFRNGGRSWQGERPFGRDDRNVPSRRFDRQYGDEIAPIDRSWFAPRSEENSDERVFYGGGYPFHATPSASTTSRYPSGAKWIDVASNRLDRSPIGPNGIDVAYAGGSKIIRVGPGFSAVSDRRHAGLERKGGMQPWSSAWLRHCTASHRSFDPALGTYVAADGRVRFCTVP